MEKKEISAVLEEMGTLLELKGENPFKARAFHNASRVLDGVTGDLRAMAESGTLTEVKGIGKSIAEIISDLVTKGSSKDYNSLRKSFPSGVLEMLRIQGLGPKRVKILFEKLKIKDVAGLEQAAKAGKLATIEGFGKKTEENILSGIVALRSRSDKSLYSTASEAAQTLFSAIVKQPGVLRGEIAGSIRRRKEVIGDIDIVLSANETARPKIMQAFTSHPSVQSVIARGDTKSSVVLSAGINCDLRIVSDKEFPFALNYFTGSKEHNVELRGRARRFGLSLNEYGFTPIEDTPKGTRARKPVQCKSEEELYASLDLAYVPPELRENLGEIEAAEKAVLPRLVEPDDIHGTFHCHTTFSDGVNTLEEMAQAAKRLGWEYLGIGDHSKAAAYAGGLSEAKVRQQFKAIDSLNASLKGFRIYKGTECDILPDGTLDWSDAVLASFEYVVVSVHSSFRMSEPEMTKRIIRALKHKHATMLGHPTGRLLLSRDPYPVNMVQIVDAASDYGKTIEINAHPMRLDLDWRLCKYAKEKGVVIAINPDAHNIDGLHDVSYGVGIARKGWLEPKDILNTRTRKQVDAFFKTS